MPSNNPLLEYAWMIALLPALSFPINLAKKFKEPLPAYIGMALIFASWLWSVAIFFTTLGTPEAIHRTFTWLPAAANTINLGFQIDHLTTVMLLVVTTVSFLVQLYSTGYMHGDPRFNRFYGFLGLFTAAMLALVIADNYLLLMIAWELVGVSSYLLIGFWFEKPSAMRAAKKAFIVTRVGDLGLLMGVVVLWNTFHTFVFKDIFAALNPHDPAMIVAAGSAAMLLFIGAVGKSAQFPLHIWLPDAMEGPTPVSALIHAATMVAAGVYLVGRSFPLFEYGSLHTFNWNLLVYHIGVTPLGLVRWLGVLTLFMAATIAVAQNDIKRVLAYSTVSQLGYMVMGIGCGAWVAGLFHLMTHACFKALLFLGSGSVIHGTGTQDMREMGGLRKLMPKTTATYFIGYLALAGFPLLAGFWSKDAILDGAKLLMVHEGKWVYYVLASAGAFLTAFYMTRQMYMVFGGKAARNPSLHIHESPFSMWFPLAFLAVPSLLVGFVGVPRHNLFKEYLTSGPEKTASARMMVAQAGNAPLTAVPGPSAGEGSHGAAAASEMPAYLSDVDLNAPGVDPALRVIHAAETDEAGLLGSGLNPGVAIPSILIGLFGIFCGWLMYGRRGAAVTKSEAVAEEYAHQHGLHASHGDDHGHDAHGHGHGPALDAGGFWREPLAAMGGLYRFLENKWYWDEFYMITVVAGCLGFSKVCAWVDKNIVDGLVNLVGLVAQLLAAVGKWLDAKVVDGIVNGVGWIAGRTGRNLRYIQTGRVQNYAVVLYLGVLLLVALGVANIPHH